MSPYTKGKLILLFVSCIKVMVASYVTHHLMLLVAACVYYTQEKRVCQINTNKCAKLMSHYIHMC